MKDKKVKKQKRIKQGPRFKVLDAVIILLIITSALGIYFRYNLFDTLKNQMRMQEYVISFSVQNIRNSTTNYLNIDDVVYYAEDGTKLGELRGYSEESPTALKVRDPASEYFVDQSGNVVRVLYPESDSMSARVDVEGKIVCQGSYSEASGFLVNGSRYLAPGQTIDIQTETVSLTIVVQDIVLAE